MQVPDEQVATVYEVAPPVVTYLSLAPGVGWVIVRVQLEVAAGLICTLLSVILVMETEQPLMVHTPFVAPAV